MAPDVRIVIRDFDQRVDIQGIDARLERLHGLDEDLHLRIDERLARVRERLEARRPERAALAERVHRPSDETEAGLLAELERELAQEHE
ncbi:MAG: hypothetical protein CL878_06350 [Dehalococcoidia bacterium]|nr:hypothetical protein [Dehalococcoidia bacterium]